METDSAIEKTHAVRPWFFQDGARLGCPTEIRRRVLSHWMQITTLSLFIALDDVAEVLDLFAKARRAGELDTSTRCTSTAQEKIRRRRTC